MFNGFEGVFLWHRKYFGFLGNRDAPHFVLVGHIDCLQVDLGRLGGLFEESGAPKRVERHLGGNFQGGPL